MGEPAGQRHRPIRAQPLNPGKSQGRPNEKHGLEAHRRKRPTRLRSPKKAPVPDHQTLGPDPDGPSEPHFHATRSGFQLGVCGRRLRTMDRDPGALPRALDALRGGEPCLLRSPPRGVPVDVDGMRDQKPTVPSHEPARRSLSDSAAGSLGAGGGSRPARPVKPCEVGGRDQPEGGQRPWRLPETVARMNGRAKPRPRNERKSAPIPGTSKAGAMGLEPATSGVTGRRCGCSSRIYWRLWAVVCPAFDRPVLVRQVVAEWPAGDSRVRAGVG